MPGIAYTLGLDPAPAISGLNAVRGALSGFTGMIGKLGGLAGFAGGIGIAGAAVMGFKKAIDQAANMETLQTSFQVMLGSASEAKSMLEKITAFAAATPMDMPGIAEAARTLLNFGVAAKDIMPDLQQLGDVSGGDSERFSRMALVFGQVSSAAKLQGQDLLQFINAGFNPLLEISKQTGESMGSLRIKMESGAIGIDQVKAALKHATSEGGQFFGMMQKQSGTWNGLMSTFKDNLNAIFREFGAPILPELKPLLSEGITLADRLAASARTAGETLAQGIGFFRQQFSDGTLSSTLGLSLRAGFAIGTDFLIDKLSDIFLKISEQAPKLFAGLATFFEGLGLAFAKTIKEGLTGITQDTAVERNMQHLGLLQMGHALGGPGKGFFDGLSKDGEAALAELKKRFSEFQNERGFDTEYLAGLEAPEKPAKGKAASAADFINTQKIDPLSDRLAKIGGFIGSSGGPRGERAALDTAKWTQKTAESVDSMFRFIQSKGFTGDGVFV